MEIDHTNLRKASGDYLVDYPSSVWLAARLATRYQKIGVLLSDSFIICLSAAPGDFILHPLS